MERAFAFYFYAQAATMPFLWGTYLIAGPGPFYGMVYGMCTAVVLLAVGAIAVLALNTRRYRARAASVALMLTGIMLRIAYVGIGRSLVWWDWLLLVEAGILAWSALVLGGTSPYLSCRRACLILSFYWTMRATLDIGFLLEWPQWGVIGVWGPTVLAVIALTALWAVPWEAVRSTRLPIPPH